MIDSINSAEEENSIRDSRGRKGWNLLVHAVANKIVDLSMNPMYLPAAKIDVALGKRYFDLILSEKPLDLIVNAAAYLRMFMRLVNPYQ